MGIALFTAASLLAPVHKLLRNCVAATARRFAPDAQSMVHPYPLAQAVRANCAWPTQARGIATDKDTTLRPLRVLRVVDGLQGSRGSGRMVISGRMADVCAELDRLVACEGRGV
jgi:hypothetical protein